MAKTLALVFGIFFVLIGILGFLPNQVIGQGAFFATDTPHNILHVVTGLALVFAALRMALHAPSVLKTFGVLYIAIAVLGFVFTPDGGVLLGLIATNAADHLLHLVLGIVILVAGFVGKGSGSPAVPQM